MGRASGVGRGCIASGNHRASRMARRAPAAPLSPFARGAKQWKGIAFPLGFTALAAFFHSFSSARGPFPHTLKFRAGCLQDISYSKPEQVIGTIQDISKEVKTLVQTLPDLELPHENAYIIIETDGSMEGWGGVCKWKQAKYDPKKTEKICAYASGKFSIIKSIIDAEIHACMEALSAMKIHYLDKKEITLRTDYHAIIKFFNKSVSNKPSRVRWITFTDYITGTGVDIKYEHIEGVNNELADALSRLVHHIANKATLSEDHIQLLGQVGDSVEETQDASDTIKGVLGRTIMALFTKVTPVNDTGN
ncbi:hypothetical protein ZIOFF_028105 [Zingiber officinale]|uniref:RNase H type-1 domain-containing protein n=1 Tax=Zingiber officinale TaxID=94328 RepID=A0A8J5GP92_ZINOF|nr:hypothetical protein ZIOFF_028105 [Zingiber officinale]